MIVIGSWREVVFTIKKQGPSRGTKKGENVIQRKRTADRPLS